MMTTALSLKIVVVASPAGQPVVLLKGSQDSLLDVANANININAVLYMKMNATSRVEGSSKGLSKGAVAGTSAMWWKAGSTLCLPVLPLPLFTIERDRGQDDVRQRFLMAAVKLTDSAAGIVVGSCCCVTVVIVLAFVVRRRRRRRQSEELSTVEAKVIWLV
jgi:hypothetical protein